MHTYVILRRAAWPDSPSLERAASRSARVVQQDMQDQLRWLRSYVIREADGTLGTACIYQARDLQAIHEHARRAGLPVDEVLPVSDTVIVQPDPVHKQAAA